MQYLNLLGLYPEAVVAPENYVHRHAGYDNSDWDEFSKLKCIIMARDPYLSAIRFLHNGQTVEDCAKHWNSFLKSYTDLNYIILNLDVKKEDRLEHLCQIAEFIGKWPNKYESEIRKYADAWLPVKGTSSVIKQRYVESGILPTNHNWKLLDDAVVWYKALHTQEN